MKDSMFLFPTNVMILNYKQFLLFSVITIINFLYTTVTLYHLMVPFSKQNHEFIDNIMCCVKCVW